MYSLKPALLEQQRKVNQVSGEEEERKREYVLKKLSDARWACHADCIKAFHHTIKAVIATLDDIRENEKKANIVAEAKGLLQNVQEFEFILALDVLDLMTASIASRFDTNNVAERAFSKLKLIKSRLRSTMNQERLQ
ncbi:Hypothetical predicted protein, partial [Paramuricea clavata]